MTDSMVESIEPARLKGMMERGEMLVVDVRDPDEFDGPLGHVPGAHNLPVAAMPDRLAALAYAKDRPVTTMCGAKKRAETAARLMIDAGFKRVTTLRGGLAAWREQGFAVEGGEVDRP